MSTQTKNVKVEAGDEFPRACKNCGQIVERWKNGALRHRQNRSSYCPIFREYRIERDGKGMPTALHWLGDYVIPDRKGN